MSDRLMQRIRGAIDRSLAEAEELARQRGNTPANGAAGSRSASTTRSTSATRRPAKSSRPNHDAPDGGPDPAVFEAAFVLDESETPSRTGTPKPPAAQGEKDGGDKPEGGAGANGNRHNGDAAETETKAEKEDAHRVPELSIEVKTRLRKLEKLEATYPELLRSYRIAHGRATSIEPFERALKENTPLVSIKDPTAFIEYINQLNLKSAMVMDELKRVTTEKDGYKKKMDAQEEELVALKAQISTEHAPAATDSAEERPVRPSTPKQDTVKSPASGVLHMFSPKSKARMWNSGGEKSTEPAHDKAASSEEFFSYEHELPQFQADLTAKAEAIDNLRAEVETLKSKLAAAEENSSELSKSLENAQRQVDESRDSAAEQVKLKTQLEARIAEVTNLTDRLDKTQAQLEDARKRLQDEQEAASAKAKDAQDKLNKTQSRADDLDLELQKSSLAKTGLEKRVNELVDQLEQEKSESQDKIAKLSEQIRTATSSPRPAEPVESSPASLAAPSATGGVGGSSKKKNNRKKKKGGANASTATGAGAPPSTAGSDKPDTEEQRPHSPVEVADVAALEQEISRLRDDVSEKDRQIDRLSRKRKTEDDLREEIENLQDNLITIGQDHVEAKQRIKDLESEKRDLQDRITELEKELQAAPNESALSQDLQRDFDTLQRDYDDLRQKSKILQVDVGAAEQLAQTRYKDLSDLREVLQKVQPELKSLRQDSAALKTAKEELLSKTVELRTVERKEKEVKSQLARAQQANKTLEDQLAAETKTKVRLEEAQRVSGRDLRRSEAEKIEISAREEKASRELRRLQEEANKLRPRIKELEDEVEKLKREKATARDEAELKSQQYTTAQGLLGGMRDQTAELTLQLKEARSQAESLEEELIEVQKLLRERTHEGETMRRLLADVDERANAKVREMRSQLETAVEERDRLEDEANARARRTMRETEELRNKVRDLERDVKDLTAKKDELEETQSEWARRKEELETDAERSRAELDQANAATGGLRKALDENEQKTKALDQQRADLKRVLEEQRTRYDKMSKELGTLRSRLGVGIGGGLSSGRSSAESTRVGSISNGSAAGGGPVADVMYIKTVMLQFLEQKDGRLRSQLVPVLSKLLHFDKNDEQKWLAALQHLEVK